MRHTLREYFHYTRAERDAAFALLALLILAVLLPFSWRYLLPARLHHWTPPPAWEAFVAEIEARERAFHSPSAAPAFGPYDPNSSSYEALVEAGWPPHMARSLVRYREKGGHFRKVEDLKRLYLMSDDWYERLAPWCRLSQAAAAPKNTAVVPAAQKVHRRENARPRLPSFPFDPNTLSEDSLVLAGFPPRVARNVVRYRQAGGRFRDAASLRKIYGMSDSLFARLAPFIQIDSPPTADTRRQAQQKAMVAPAETEKAPSLIVDVNRASLEEWMQLKGIGRAYGSRILRFREALGGFASIEQVGETRGLPDSVFQQIRPMLAWSPILRKLDLNTADIRTLSAHPYITRMQARAIVAWRSQHGHYSNPEEVRRTGVFSEREIERLLPYLECSTQTY